LNRTTGKDRNVPVHKIIFLQYEDDAATGETTWCEDRINDTDLVYALVAEPLQLVLRCDACGMFGTPIHDYGICGNCGSIQTEFYILIPSGLTTASTVTAAPVELAAPNLIEAQPQVNPDRCAA
jgi:hypothetical protein